MRKIRHDKWVATIALGAMLSAQLATPLAYASTKGQNDDFTSTPIKHLIVLIGENRSFDHVFATYQPRHGQSLLNLPSEGIVRADGSSGSNARAAAQFEVDSPTAIDLFHQRGHEVCL